MITKSDIDSLRTLLKSGADVAFFFSTIKDPAWLPALRDNGFFSSPPKPTRRGDTFLHPIWPESRFLAGMADKAPAEVVAIAKAIPETENVNVNEDIFRVAAAVPVEHVGPLLPRIAKWLRTADLRWHSHAVAKFVSGIAESGRMAEALGMMMDLFVFKMAPVPAGEEVEQDRLFIWRPEPETRWEAYEYAELLKGILPALAKADWRRTLTALCRVLDGYVVARNRTDDDRPGYDGSVYWRPAIDEDQQNSQFDEATELGSAIRRLGEDEVRAGHATVTDILGITQKFKWDIFRRMEMHWMRVLLPQVELTALKAALIDREHVRSGRFDLEYGLLIQAAYAKLAPVEKNQILDWIAEGPEVAAESETVAVGGTTEIAKQYADWANRWRIKRLYWIKDQLPLELRAKYDQWISEFGEPEHPGYPTWSGGFEVVRQTPISAEEFHAMVPAKQVEYLRAWQPAEQWHGPTKEALAGLLQAEVGQNIAIYVANARLFVGLNPAYVAGFLSAIWEKQKNGAEFPMGEVWALGHWVLEQADEEIELFDEFTKQTRRGRHWQPARLALARLLNSLLQLETNGLPQADRKEVWTLVEILAADPDPAVTATAETSDEDGSMGPFTLSLNCVRGEAVHAALAYIGWCRRASAPTDRAGIPAEASLLLGKLLDPLIEPTLTIRSVFGANINRFAYWDTDWLKAHWPRIFPAASNPILDAIAWTTFMTHASPYRDVFEILRERFVRAVREMIPPKVEKTRHDPRVYLGRYLVNLYWWGLLDFTIPGDLLAEFFLRAPDNVRGEVLEFVGRTLKNTKEKVSPEILTQLRSLWEWRLGQARAAGGKGFAAEVGSFAWWFDSGRFDDVWSAQQMVQALELSRRYANQFLWIKRFAGMAESQPALAVRALKATVENAGEASGKFWHDDEAIIILRAGFKSAEPGVIEIAKRIQDAFLRENRTQYLNLD